MMPTRAVVIAIGSVIFARPFAYWTWAVGLVPHGAVSRTDV